jgi:hypothetical protein
MKLFGRRLPKSEPRKTPKGESEAHKTAPGLRAIKELWQVDATKKKVEPIEGQVVTDIYATPRNNGIPRRPHPRRSPPPAADAEYDPPY